MTLSPLEDPAHASGLTVDRRFTQDNEEPLDAVQWTTRPSTIRDPAGNPVFHLDAVEVPVSWSQLATDILASKYLRKGGVPQPDGSTGAETSARQVITRVTGAIRAWGVARGVFAAETDAASFEAELQHILINQMGAFNSPVWFNVGLHHAYGIQGTSGLWTQDPETGEVVPAPDSFLRPQCSACFIQGVADSLVGDHGIFDLLSSEARLFKYGSGTGTNFSTLRSSHEALSGGGTSSGLMPFLKVFDSAAGATKSGGTTRRAAKMVCLDMDHPEISSFIDWKVEEEKKVRALVAAGYDGSMSGEAYATVSGQNANNSVRVPDAFLRAVEEDGEWSTRFRTNGDVCETMPARELWDKVVEAAWACADPGVQYHDTINTWHTCKASGPINASNPCSEYMFLDDSACNLASLNLMKFRQEDGSFDIEAFRHAVRILFIAQEILVGYASYPTKRIAENSYRYRPLGLGYANLGAILMAQGLPYDSPEGRALAGAFTSLMTGHAYKVSAEMAEVLGPFDALDDEADDGLTNRDSMAHVMEMHLAAAQRLAETGSPVKELDGSLTEEATAIAATAVEDWQAALDAADGAGWRNAQASVLAPTGTIGLLMDCDTTGVEPDFSLVKYKRLADGGTLRIVNQGVPAALQALGYDEEDITMLMHHILGHGTLEGGPVDKETFLDKGFTEEQYQQAYDHVAENGSFDDHMPGITPKAMLEAGFSHQAVRELRTYIEGHQTLEGSLIEQEHLAVFDCANRCGDGQRSITPMGHIRMMAAAQPFLSGAISKTVNLPQDASQDDVREAFEQGWRLGLKAVAVYRDGCKAAQPLSSGREHAKEEKKAGPGRGQQVEPPRDNDMGFKRTITIFTQHGAEKVDIQVWEYPDGTPCEVFVGARRSGTTVDDFLKEMGKNYSRILQLGLGLDSLTRKMMNAHGPLAGQTDHPYIKRCLGIQDLLGKLLRYEYFGETAFLSVKPDPEDPDYVPTRRETLTRIQQARMRPQGEVTLDEFVPDTGQGDEDSLAALGGDAPPCDICGHTTVLNGACYKCLNCGNSMGCS